MGLTVHIEITEKDGVVNKTTAYEFMYILHEKAKQMKNDGIFRVVEGIKTLDEYVQEQDKSDERFVLSLDNSPEALKNYNYHPFRQSIYTKQPYINFYGRRNYKNIRTSLAPSDGIFFNMQPGLGTEWITIGLFKYPRSFKLYRVENERRDELQTIKNEDGGWRHSDFCKTQYANGYGPVNFLKSHIGLITLLEGIDNSEHFSCRIHDEGDFYENKNIYKFVKEVITWDRMIGGLKKSFASVVNDMQVTSAMDQVPDMRTDFEMFIELTKEMLSSGELKINNDDKESVLEAFTVGVNDDNVMLLLKTLSDIWKIQKRIALMQKVNDFDAAFKYWKFVWEDIYEQSHNGMTEATRLILAMKAVDGKKVTEITDEQEKEILDAISAYQVYLASDNN